MQNELTGKAIALGILLSSVLGAATVYMGLKAGLTVSASIPAAVISMTILRLLFRNVTVQENNIVQSAASAGESLAAGVIFTVPALVIGGYWSEFDYFWTTLIAVIGGILGVVVMVPMRKSLIEDHDELSYPEGIACAEVLQAGEDTTNIKGVLGGLAFGAVYKFGVGALGIAKGGFEFVFTASQKLFYFGLDLSPALVGVGYVVGLRIATLIVIGGGIVWLIALPIVFSGKEFATTVEGAYTLWSTKLRFIGVGAMLGAGVYSIWQVRASLVAAWTNLTRKEDTGDMSRRWVTLIAGICLLMALLGLVLLDIGILHALLLLAVAAVTVFVFVGVAAYTTGLVGSSNSPVSGMTLCSLLLIGVLATALFEPSAAVAVVILFLSGIVCCAACTSGDIAQDLKTGFLVKATPAKQQWAEVLGVLAAAFVLSPVLVILHEAYTIGSKELAAPQAGLFASITKALVGDGEIQWPFFWWGLAISIVIIAIDIWSRRQNTRSVPPMPIAVGMYLPFGLGVPIFIGGLIASMTSNRRLGILLVSGIIAGESLAGIGLAGLILGTEPGTLPIIKSMPDWAGLSVFVVCIAGLARILSKKED